MAEMNLDEVLSPNKPVTDKKITTYDIDDVLRSENATFESIKSKLADSIIQNAMPENLNSYEQFEQSLAETVVSGAKKTPEGVKMLYGQAKMMLADRDGNEEEIAVGKSLIQSAARSMDMINEQIEKRSPATEGDRDTFAWGTGNAAASFGSMVLTGGVATTLARGAGLAASTAQAVGTGAGLATMYGQEVTGEAEEGIGVYREQTGDFELQDIDPKWAGKEFLTTNTYGLISGVIENKLGFGLMRKTFLKPMDIAKRAVVGGVSEYTTENLQSLANMGIDLADGSITWDKFPERLKADLIGNLPALLIGAGGGASMGIQQRSNVKNAIREQIKGTVPAKDLEVVVNNVYDSAIEDMAGIVAKEVELSSELQAKHGKVYDSVLRAVQQEVANSGSDFFEGQTDDDIAQYVADTSKVFADQVLAEANLRQVPIDEVLDAQNIEWNAQDGIIFSENIDMVSYVKGEKKTPRNRAEEVQRFRDDLEARGIDYKTMPRENLTNLLEAQQIEYTRKENPKAMKRAGVAKAIKQRKEKSTLDRLKQRGISPEFAKMFDLQSLMGWQDAKRGGGLFINKKDAIDKEDSLVEFFVEEGLVNQDDPNAIDKVFDILENLSIKDMSGKVEMTDADVEGMIDNSIYDYAQIMGYNIDNMTLQEKEQIYSQMMANMYDRADPNEVTPLSEQDFGELLGDVFFQEGTYDAQGKADINTKEFKEWFGDSKVVDENGEPLVVYHGTKSEFDVFDIGKGGKSNSKAGVGFWFSDEEVFAQNFASDLWYGDKEANVYPVYLNLKKPKIYESKEVDEEALIEAQQNIEKIEAEISEERKKANDEYMRTYSFAAMAPFEKNIEVLNGRLRKAEDNKNEIIYSDAYEQYRTDLYKTIGQSVSDANIGGLGMSLKDNTAPQQYVEALKKEGYDGIIIKGTSFDSHHSEKETNNQFVAFNPNQIKSVYNKGTFSKDSDNIYYQSGDKNLVVQHNVNLEKLNNAIALGALPMPSLAVKKATSDLQYGDIAFIGGSRVIDPNRGYGENKVFSNDIYSTRKVDPSHFAKQELTDYLNKNLEWLSDIGDNAASFRSEILQDLDSNRDDSLRYLFIKEKNLSPYPFERIYDASIDFDKLSDKQKGEFNSWKADFVSKYVDKKLFKGYKSSGDRIYKEFDLMNVIAEMKSQPLRGSESFSSGNLNALRGMLAKEFSSIQDLKKSEDKLVDKEAYDKSVEIMEGAFEKLSEEIWTDEANDAAGWDTDGYLVDMLMEIKPSNVSKKLQEYNLDNSKKSIKMVKDFIALVQEMPARYFEAKPQRAVDFSEFSGVIMPTSEKYDAAANEMASNYGLKVVRSDNQTEAIQEFENVFFQKRVQGARGKTTIQNNALLNKRMIKLLEGADYSTLPHEMAHYWLDNMWEYARSGLGSDSYMERWGVVADWLGIRDEATRLTRNQQEKFASGYEKYLTMGILPTPMLKGSFDDYDKWLKKVYNTANDVKYQSNSGRKEVKLTDDAIRFFNSMTTGELAPAKVKAAKQSKATDPMKAFNKGLKTMGSGQQAPTVKENLTTQAPVENLEGTVVEKVTEVVKETIKEPTSNITEGEKGESSVYKREIEKVGEQIASELGLTYNKITLDDQAMRAKEYVENNVDLAKDIIDGNREAPNGVLDTSIRIAYENKMLEDGNYPEFIRALKLHSTIATLRGQNIAAERIATKDMLDARYWVDKLLTARQDQVVKSLFKGDVKKYQDYIQKVANEFSDKIAKEKDFELQKAKLVELQEKIKKDYGIETLYQLDIDAPLNEKTAPTFLKNFIEESLGTKVSAEEGQAIIEKAMELKNAFEGSLDTTGNPTVESMRILSEMNDVIASFAPSPAITVLTSIFGRSMMLASVKSPTLNIISNVENAIVEGVVRRVSLGANEKSVDKKAIDDYNKYAWDVYKASGFIPSQMQSFEDEVLTLGESRPTSQGKGAIRKVSQVAENIVFKYLMGAPDAKFKDFTFTDTADLMATKIAKSEGLEGDALSARSTEIFKDATLVVPQTQEGRDVRNKAIEEAHVATYTNDSVISKFALEAREWLNNIKLTKNLRLGDSLMPFVKTPANVAMLGLEYSLGSVYSAYNIKEVLRNPQSDKSKRAMKALFRNGMGFTISLLLASLFEPEDYIPAFDAASSQDKSLAMAKNAPFNSIRIGDKWVSLDYFGVFGIPFVGIMNARKRKELKDKVWGYLAGSATQAANVPGVEEVGFLYNFVKDLTAESTSPEKMLEKTGNSLFDQIRARTIPAIVNDIAKATDPYVRDTKGSTMDKVKAGIPFLRQTLPTVYNANGQRQEGEGFLSNMLFGSRVKTANDGAVVKEWQDLADEGEKASMTDPTRYGDLRHLDPEDKVKVRAEYNREYAKKAKSLMATRAYNAKSAEGKKESLNKIRKNVVKKLKSKYNSKIERAIKEVR